jgi:hypothetical protein
MSTDHIMQPINSFNSKSQKIKILKCVILKIKILKCNKIVG